MPAPAGSRAVARRRRVAGPDPTPHPGLVPGGARCAPPGRPRGPPHPPGESVQPRAGRVGVEQRGIVRRPPAPRRLCLRERACIRAGHRPGSAGQAGAHLLRGGACTTRDARGGYPRWSARTAPRTPGYRTSTQRACYRVRGTFRPAITGGELSRPWCWRRSSPRRHGGRGTRSAAIRTAGNRMRVSRRPARERRRGPTSRRLPGTTDRRPARTIASWRRSPPARLAAEVAPFHLLILEELPCLAA